MTPAPLLKFVLHNKNLLFLIKFVFMFRIQLLIFLLPQTVQKCQYNYRLNEQCIHWNHHLSRRLQAQK